MHSPFFKEKKSLRKSTAERSKERAKREKEREMKAKMLKEIAAQKRVAEVRRLTQEELLEEAKITEELNLQSLGRFTLSLVRFYYVFLKTSLYKYHKLTFIVLQLRFYVGKRTFSRRAPKKKP